MRVPGLMVVGLLAAMVSLAVSQPPPPPGGKGPPPKGKTRPVRERPEELKVELKEPTAGWVQNPRFTERDAHYKLQGDAVWGRCSSEDEFVDFGVALHSGVDVNKDGNRSGSVTQVVTGFPMGIGKWYRFRVRGLAEPGFTLTNGSLAMRVEYFAKNKPLDGVTQELYPLIEHDRIALAVNGKNRKNGGSVWKTYSLDFRLPFGEIDTLQLGVGFKNGSATVEKRAEFYVTDFGLEAIPAPADAPKVVKTERGLTPSITSLMALGGRWYYDPEPGMKERPATLVVNVKNAHRLYYMDGRLSNPFAENMTAWLRKGMLDIKGAVVEEDRFIADNVVLEFKDGKELIVHTRNLPNHATAKSPDRFGNRNPNFIQMMDRTYYLPLEPTRNPKAIAMDKTNSNRALQMGPIGFAINGVAFFNPFDMDGVDAVDLMDRCCGHPAPDSMYHYHKYPVCVKSPFVDDGEGHSPLIGFAFDGFPIYGPYVAKGVMAKDAKENPLDAFNMRNDDERGWHYHVTPGTYPYILGGYGGTPDPRNLRRGPPR